MSGLKDVSIYEYCDKFEYHDGHSDSDEEPSTCNKLYVMDFTQQQPSLKGFVSLDSPRSGALAPRDANVASPARDPASKTSQSSFNKSLTDFYFSTQARADKPYNKQPSAAPPKKTAAAGTSNSKKRKIAADDPGIKAVMFPEDAPEIDEEDPRLMELGKGYTCHMVRKKIKAWTDSGAQKVSDFQDEVGISPEGYANFMNRQGTWDGEYCDLYMLAARFFRKRELQGLPLSVPKSTTKKTKTDDKASGKKTSDSKKTIKSSDDILDVSGVELPGEAEMRVQVYDTCGEMRKRLRKLQTQGCSQAAICRALSTSYPEGSGKSVTATNMRSFMSNKGVMGGNTSNAFYGGYVFFEKRRIKDGKPKSKFREEMEQVHEAGVDVERNLNGPCWLRAGESVSFDKYGQVHIG